MNGLDVGLLVFLALMAYWGYRKGLLRSVIGLVAYGAAVAVSLLAGPRVSAWMRTETELGKRGEQYVVERIESSSYGFLLDIEVPPETVDLLREYPELQTLADNNLLLRLLLSGQTQEGVSLIAALAGLIFTIVVIIVLFVATKLVMTVLLRGVARNVDAVPLLSGVNRIAGMALNIVSGLVLVAVIALAAGQLAWSTEGSMPQSIIADSVIINSMYSLLGWLFAAVLQA